MPNETPKKNWLNKIIAFLTGLFLSAILGLAALKMIGNWAIVVLLVSMAILSFKGRQALKTEYYIIRSLLAGMMVFSILSLSISIALLIFFFGSIQSILS
ncbi:hypothetical protein IT412_00835 [Candidatus Peregrinibacteria bacterium]|nr:hypothetical protein [Candidatus Peregrinibacteria bacterium]